MSLLKKKMRTKKHLSREENTETPCFVHFYSK
jgi:hypothetical protein